ncbi:MAG TPA: helix-turn-helix transcriptional regulator [Thermoanaerobaculia bacterium]|nr:helix-turn-helix transcriptional regulator [Thermoanaerobaculia bacterium]
MFEPFSDLVRLRRKQLNLTQEKLAKLAKVSRRQLFLLESGRNVSLLFMTKIADALGITEIPMGGLNTPTAPPTLDPLVRAAEAVQTLKQAGDTWRGAAETIDATAATLDDLIAGKMARRPSAAAVNEVATRLASLPPEAQQALAETLRILAGSNRLPRAERPNPDEGVAEASEDSANRPR